MAGDYHMNDPRSGSRDQGISYGSFGPWAGAVMQGMGMMPTGPLGALGLAGSLGLQGLTGKSFGGHLGGLAAGALVGLGFVAAERRSMPALGWGVCGAVAAGAVVAAIVVANAAVGPAGY